MPADRMDRDRARRGGPSRSAAGSGAALGAAALAAGAVAGLILANRQGTPRPPDSAPGRTRRKPASGDYAVVGRTVTINKPRAELFAFWRDFANLARFMENVEAVRPSGMEQWIWTISAPGGGSVEVETEIAEERADELIAWRSVPDSQIETHGRVAFRDAPAGRGTQVEAVIAYKPPAGEIGRLIAKLFQREPGIQGRRELKRLKMLMETGEIATSRNRRERA